MILHLWDRTMVAIHRLRSQKRLPALDGSLLYLIVLPGCSSKAGVRLID